MKTFDTISHWKLRRRSLLYKLPQASFKGAVRWISIHLRRMREHSDKEKTTIPSRMCEENQSPPQAAYPPLPPASQHPITIKADLHNFCEECVPKNGCHHISKGIHSSKGWAQLS